MTETFNKIIDLLDDFEVAANRNGDYYKSDVTTAKDSKEAYDTLVEAIKEALGVSDPKSLNIVEKYTRFIDGFDLANFLSEKIGRPVEIIDTNNGQDYSVEILAEEIAPYDQNYVDKFLKSGNISMEGGWRTVLTYCANKGWLEEGHYVIGVSW